MSRTHPLADFDYSLLAYESVNEQISYADRLTDKSGQK